MSVPKQKQYITQLSRKCSKQGCLGKTPKSANFCMQCGSPITEYKNIHAQPHHPDSFLCAIFPGFNDNLSSFDPEQYQEHERFIYIPNCPKDNMDIIRIRIDEDGVYQMPTDITMERAKAAFEEDYRHEIEVLKTTVGDSDVWIEYGLLIYDW